MKASPPQQLAPAQAFKPQPLNGVFSALHEDELQALLQSATIKKFSRNSQVVRAEEPADFFYIVLEGMLEVSRTASRGKSVVLNRLGRGDVIGEVSALGGVGRTADVVCITNCELAEIPVDEFKKKLSSMPNFASYIMKCMALRLAKATSSLFNFATEDVPSRLLQVLRSLDAQGRSADNSYVVRERPTHAELARLVGTSREVVGRALSLLEASGEIQQDGKSILIRAE